MTINGAVLTVRTDSRWHINKPTGMTGSIGSYNISASLGGGVVFDGRNVRWIPFTSASGNVPAIGATLTGVTSAQTGYILGVWTSLSAAPSTPGGATPTDGFIKLREESGNFNASESIGDGAGWTATTNGADVTGWIEIVADQLETMTVPRLGSYVNRGDWFYLDDTDGSAGQRVEANYQGTFGEWQMIGNQLIFRNEAGVEIARLDLFDQTGHPTMANIFWRVPV